MTNENNNSDGFSKEELLKDYNSPLFIPEVNKQVEADVPWFNTKEGMKNTYTSENLNNEPLEQKKNTKAKLDALKRFLDEAVSIVDLPTLTIQNEMDDKGEQ